MVVGTIVSLLLVDRIGRRPLLIEGGVQVQSPKPYLHIPDPSGFPSVLVAASPAWTWVLEHVRPSTCELHITCIARAQRCSYSD